MMKWFPDRKVWQGGVAAVVAWLATTALTRYTSVSFTGDEVAAVTTLVGFAWAYFVPPSVKDIAK